MCCLLEFIVVTHYFLALMVLSTYYFSVVSPIIYLHHLHCIIYLHHLLSLLFVQSPPLQFLFSFHVLIAMDSRNPYSQSSSYMGLLNSQNFPYESFPQFSSQQTDAGTQPEDTPVDRKERSLLLKLKGIMVKGSLLLSIRPFGK